MKTLPGAIFVVILKRERIAILEAKKLESLLFQLLIQTVT
jgi:ribosomal protein S2